MSELLFSINPEDLAIGIAPDLPGQGPPVIDTGENVIFTDLSAQPISGQFLLIGHDTIAEPINGIRATIIDGQRYAFIGTPTKLYRWDGSTLTDVTNVGGNYTGDEHALWSLERWGEWMLATNGIDPPQVYKGTAFEDLSGTTFDTAKILVVAPGQPFVLAFETVGGAEGGFGRMHWCERDDVETWTGALANFAGFLPIRNIVSPVICALAYGGVIPFFTIDAMYIANFIGHPLSFAANKVIDGIGAAGKFAVTGAAGRLYGISNRGIWTSDLGGNYQYFDIPLVRDFLIADMQVEQIANHPVAWHNRAEHSIVFYYPTAGVHGNTRGLMFNYQEGNWTSLSVGRNAVDDRGIFDYALAGDRDGNVFYQAAPGQIGTEAPLPGTGVPGFLPITEQPVIYRAGFGMGPFGAFPFGGPSDG